MRLLLIILFFLSYSFAGPKLAKVSYAAGKNTIEVQGKSKTLKVNMVLRQGSIIKTGSNGIVEISYFNGDIVRLNNNAELVLEGVKEGQGSPNLKKGNLWSNIKKLTKGESGFKVKTSVATAAVRGTTFHVNAKDSSTQVHLMEGKVDVGPNGQKETTASGWGPPAEISGPQEVSMETWVSLDPGQMINVNWDGTYKASEFKKIESVDPAWVKFNEERDKLLKKK